jgi:hypothetical protein
MNNEPVAWMELYYGEPNNLSWTDAELRNSGEVYKTVPLYTHPADESFDRTASHMAGEYVSYPAKTLTDEEIAEVFDNTFKVRDFDNAFLKFARAILKKASEK